MENCGFASRLLQQWQDFGTQLVAISAQDGTSQNLQRTFIRRFDALEPRAPVVAIDVYAIQKQTGFRTLFCARKRLIFFSVTWSFLD